MHPVESRLEKLRARMREAGLDFVALIPGANLQWLSGGEHYVNERPIVLFVPVDESPLAIIPQLEVALFKTDPLQPRIVAWTDAEGYEAAFRAGMDTLGAAGKTIGVEGLRMRFFEGEAIRRYAPTATVVAADEQFSAVRVRKDEAELAALREAVRISQEALRLTLGEVEVGMSEIELARVLEGHMTALGSEEPSFKTILHGGANTALPHTGPLPYRVQAGDPLLIDFGATYGGYRADLTRVVFLSEPSREDAEFYSVVRRANEAARAAARPGVTAGSLDEAARAVINGAGYGHLLRHRTGHGIGLETHEAPYIVIGNEQVLEPGMVFTTEPGIYQMGHLGVRIEDDVLITVSGAESLSDFNRDIMVVGQ